MSELSAPEETPPARFHLNPWVATPPQSVIVEGISCTGTKQFPVDSVPSTYPYPPYLASTVPNVKPKIPYFIFSGPNPPPADIGYPGDIYVAPAAKALYAYLPADGVSGGAWTRWTAVVSDARAVQSGDGLLAHPYIPDRFLWTKNSTASFSWLTLDNIQDSLRNQINPAERERLTEAAAETLVERTLWDAQERQKSKKRPAGDPERPRKKARAKRIFFSRATSTNPWEEPAGSELYPSSSMRATTPIQEQMTTLARLMTENEQLRARLENAEYICQDQSARIERFEADAWHEWRRLARDEDQLRQEHATGVARLEAEYEASKRRVENEWQLRQRQTATIARLEAENQELRTKLAEEEHLRLDHLATIVRLEAQNEEMSTIRKNDQPLAVSEQMPFHSEFLGFMRETFTCEVMLTCNAQRMEAETAAAEAKAQVATLQSMLAATTQLVSKLAGAETRITQLEAALLEAQRESASLSTHHNDALKAAQTVNATLGAEIEPIKTGAARDAASLKLATEYLSEAQNRIALQDAEIRFLEQSRREDASLHHDLLQRIESELTQARHDALAHNAEATIKLESLTSEIERLKGAAEDDASARRLAEVGATEAQSEISALKNEITRMKQTSRREADILKTLLAAHEAEN
ncbi:hypothetical protein B0H11DRAFT_2238305 [Mycena galericulata]|nr:hypothetical protein B0H11DRAFT_2238305 [Mycena galericulata]